ncbi:hypothetical protein CCACVL1_27511, partial [Corchorus capsularis]
MAPPLLLAEETHVSEANSRLESERAVVGELPRSM